MLAGASNGEVKDGYLSGDSSVTKHLDPISTTLSLLVVGLKSSFHGRFEFGCL